MFRDDDQSFEKYNHPTPPTDDNPEELLNLLRNHLENPNEPITLDHDDLGKRPFDACNNGLEDP